MARDQDNDARLIPKRLGLIFRRVWEFFTKGGFYTTPDDPESCRRIVAYRFACGMSSAQMIAALNTAGPWRWEDRDTVWYKDELSATVSDHAIVRIYNEGAAYNLSFFFKSHGAGVKKEWQEIHQIILEQVFPALDATDVQSDSPNDPPAGWWRVPAKEVIGTTAD